MAVNYVSRPRRQGFFCDDDTIKYPYKEDTVSANVIISVTLAVPALLVSRMWLKCFPSCLFIELVACSNPVFD